MHQGVCVGGGGGGKMHLTGAKASPEILLLKHKNHLAQLEAS